MIEKYQEFTFDPELWSQAEALEKSKMMWDGQLYENRQDGKLEERLSLVTKLLVNRYHIEDNEWIASLNGKQVDSITKLVFEKETYEELKQAVEVIK